MQLWLIFSLLSVFVLAGAEISQKVSLTQKVNISAITNNFFVWTLQGTVGLVLALILGQFTLVVSSFSLIKLVLISIVYFAGGTLFYTSYKGNSPSISIILGTVSVVLSSLLGTLFLGDVWTISKIVGVVLIMCAIFVLNFNKKERINKYNVFALLGGMCYGIAFTLDKSMVVTMSPFMYLGLMCFGVALVSALSSTRLIVNETKKLVAKNYLPMISAASFGSAFNLLTFYAYKNGANVGLADAINNVTVFLVILLEVVLLKDRSNLVKKISCALIAFSGILLIALVP